MQNVSCLGAKTACLGGCVRQSRKANRDEYSYELKPRGDTADADHRLAELRSPFLPTDARLDVVPVHYIPAKDEGVLHDST